MGNIQIEIQGQDAIAATNELLSISGLSGSYEVESELEREGTLVTIATIIGIVGGTMAIAEQIRQWYKDYKSGKSGQKIEKVLIVTSQGRRLLLQDATIEQIQQVLEDIN
ncbi:MAG: hypothetical protein SAJ37_02540 [Oscillatoria sp. PMC 1068.18]|nr:hypothetical protein [Oscillatoria sp. PMC 1076.18]MEC4987600.1 hypothetical protein [Oscillatoria sp. PMC 1068.18]